MMHRAVILAITGLGILLLASGFWMSGKAALAQVLMDRAWTHVQAGQTARAPWPGMDAGPVARLAVPRLGQSAIILDRASGQALAFGPALMTDTAPFGALGVSAVAAHKNTHFAFLEQLETGDVIRIETGKHEALTYRVSGFEILNTQTHELVIPERAQTSELALITCYPFDQVTFGGPLRYIVRADLTQAVMADVASAKAFGPNNGLVNRLVSLSERGL